MGPPCKAYACILFDVGYLFVVYPFGGLLLNGSVKSGVQTLLLNHGDVESSKMFSRGALCVVHKVSYFRHHSQSRF